MNARHTLLESAREMATEQFRVAINDLVKNTGEITKEVAQKTGEEIAKKIFDHNRRELLTFIDTVLDESDRDALMQQYARWGGRYESGFRTGWMKTPLKENRFVDVLAGYLVSLRVSGKSDDDIKVIFGELARLARRDEKGFDNRLHLLDHDAALQYFAKMRNVIVDFCIGLPNLLHGVRYDTDGHDRLAKAVRAFEAQLTPLSDSLELRPTHITQRAPRWRRRRRIMWIVTAVIFTALAALFTFTFLL
jgi:vacuolar-type H+-ATPase subunit H